MDKFKGLILDDVMAEMQTVKNLTARKLDFSVTPQTNAVSQIQLALNYHEMKKRGGMFPRFDDVGFRAFSQADEDGILLFIFSLIGTSNKLCVEICAGDGIECNTANLLINHGWYGLLVDGDEKQVNRGKEFYSNCHDTYVFPPKFVHSWVTASTVNDMITDAGFAGTIDLLSIDIDGMDFWIWKAIEAVRPRVVVVEYQDILGPMLSLTVPYRDDFTARDYPMTHGMPNYCGASLRAFVKLAKEKGYRLVGTNRYGYNAFFIINGEGEDFLPEISVESCFTHPKVLWGVKERYPSIKDFPWVEV